MRIAGEGETKFEEEAAAIKGEGQSGSGSQIQAGGEVSGSPPIPFKRFRFTIITSISTSFISCRCWPKPSGFSLVGVS